MTGGSTQQHRGSVEKKGAQRDAGTAWRTEEQEEAQESTEGRDRRWETTGAQKSCKGGTEKRGERGDETIGGDEKREGGKEEKRRRGGMGGERERGGEGRENRRRERRDKCRG